MMFVDVEMMKNCRSRQAVAVVFVFVFHFNKKSSSVRVFGRAVWDDKDGKRKIDDEIGDGS